MSITVRLIFMGLIGFVPNEGGDKGLIAIFADPLRIQEPSMKCKVARHMPVVYMLDGKCTGDCRRIPEDREDDADAMGFNHTDPGRRLELAWLVDGEDLEISRIEHDEVKLRKPGFLARQPKIIPSGGRQLPYFSWVPSMGVLTGGHGEMRADCLGDQGTCPLNARFRVDGGTASACHLFHDVDETPAADGKSRVRIFDYTIPTPQGPRLIHQQAAADAVLVEFKVKGDSVELHSWDLPIEYGQQAKLATATLRPEDGSDVLTLIVAHLPGLGSIHPLPPEEGRAQAHHQNPCATSHSDILYDLLAREPSPRPSRTLSDRTERLNPGSCEPEMLRIAALLQGEPPHSPTACDGSTFP